jgi:ABC-type spermidine/putrescine transport system permease subunit I
VAGVRGLATGRGRGAGGPGRAAVLRGLLPLLPLLLFLLGLVAYPVGRVLALSLAWPGPFPELAAAPLYRETLLRTFRVSATVTAACLLLGYPVAYTLARAPRRRGAVLLALVLVPFWISVLGRSFTWLVLLQRNGVVNQLLLGLGLVREPLPLVYNELGVHVGMTHILLPFMILSLYSVLRGISPTLLRAAANLGAGEWQAFRRVYLPLSAPGVAAGAVLVFVMGLGFFITPALLGGGRVTLLAMLIEAHVHQALDWEVASALSVVLLAATVLVLLPASRVLRFDRAFGAGHR